MIRRREFAIAGMSTAALAALHVAGLAHDRKSDAGGKDARLETCSKACSDCQRECDRCATYCAGILSKGTDHHLMTLMSCQDCAEVCATASQIVARGGPHADLICHACAETCTRCAKECDQHAANDKVMARCAEECRRCEKACREMMR